MELFVSRTFQNIYYLVNKLEKQQGAVQNVHKRSPLKIVKKLIPPLVHADTPQSVILSLFVFPLFFIDGRITSYLILLECCILPTKPVFRH